MGFKNHIVPIIIVLLAITILNNILVFGQIWFIDYSLAFEGSYRTFIGQVPYIDFYAPVGPVLFYLQSLFFYLFGPNILAMSLHVITISFILCMIFYYYIRKEFNVITRIFLTISMYISFYGLIAYPWYNQTAFFFILTNLLIILINKKIELSKILLISLILGIFAYFSKQDIGLYSFIAFSLFFFYNHKKDFKKILFLYIIPFIILTILITVCLNSANGFLLESAILEKIGWFINPLYFAKLIVSPYLYLGILFIYLLIKEKDKNQKKLISINLILIFICLLSAGSSSLNFQTFVTGVPLIIVNSYLYIKKKFPNINYKSLLKDYLIILILILLLFNYTFFMYHSTYSSVTENYARSLQRIYVSNSNNSDSLKYFPSLDGRCSSNIILESKTLKNDLDIIKGYIEKNNLSFFNMADFTFLYCDYNIEPPRNIPLWFDYGLSYSNDSIILDYLNKERPKIIIIPISKYEFNDPNIMLYNKFRSIGYSTVYETKSFNGYKLVYVLELNDN